MTTNGKGAKYRIPVKTTSATVKVFSADAFSVIKIIYFRTKPPPFTFSALLLSLALNLAKPNIILPKATPGKAYPGPQPVTAPPIPGYPSPGGPPPEAGAAQSQNPPAVSGYPAQKNPPPDDEAAQSPEAPPIPGHPHVDTVTPETPPAGPPEAATKPSPDAPAPQNYNPRCAAVSALKAKQLIENYLLSNIDKTFYHIALTFAGTPESKKEALGKLSQMAAAIKKAGYSDFAYIAVPHKTDELFSMHIHLVYTSDTLTPETIARDFWTHGYVTINRKLQGDSPRTAVRTAQKLSKYLLKDQSKKEKSQKVFLTSSNLQKNYKEYFLNLDQLDNLQNYINNLSQTETIHIKRLSNIRENPHSLTKDIIILEKTPADTVLNTLDTAPQNIAPVRNTPFPPPSFTKSSALLNAQDLAIGINSGTMSLKYILERAAPLYPALSPRALIKTGIILRKTGIFPIPTLDPLLIALYTQTGQRDAPVNPDSYPIPPILEKPEPFTFLKYRKLLKSGRKTKPP
jgi:hypothetical protein